MYLQVLSYKYILILNAYEFVTPYYGTYKIHCQLVVHIPSTTFSNPHYFFHHF
jgi:hypothetical protein